MTVQAGIAAELPFLRAEAEARMLSVVTVRRKTGKSAQDETSGKEAPVWDDVHTNIPFRLGGSNSGSAGSRTLHIGDGDIEVAVRVGHFRAATTDLADGDLVDITAGENAGLVLRIVEADWQDQATARRVPVVTTQRPVEWA